MARKGFTLIELIMVIVIIGILAAVAIPRFINLRNDAQKAQCEGSAAAIQTALSNYYSRTALQTNTAAFPTSLGLSAFVSDYLAEGSLPSHPKSWTWNNYYNATTGVLSVSDGACNF